MSEVSIKHSNLQNGQYNFKLIHKYPSKTSSTILIKAPTTIAAKLKIIQRNLRKALYFTAKRQILTAYLPKPSSGQRLSLIT